MSTFIRPARARDAFTLVEVVLAMTILFIGGLAVIGAIVYTRQSMEVNKQTITAMNHARRLLEEASTNSGTDSTTGMVVLHFNDPGLDVPADVSIAYYPLTTTGEVDWETSTPAPIQGEPTYARVILSWDSMGNSGRRHSVTLASLVRAGTL